MQATQLLVGTAPRQAVAALGKLTMAALVGLAVALVYVQAAIAHSFNPSLTVFAALMLGGAGLIRTGWRWTPMVGTLLSSLVVLGNSAAVVYDLTHPGSLHLFTFMVVAVALAAVGVVSGISATVQNYRSGSRDMPGAGVPLLSILVGLCIGAVLVATIPQEAGASVSPEVLASLPALATPGMAFDQEQITVKAGTLVAMRLENTHGAPHSFDVDELNVHVPIAAGKQGLILFQPTTPGTYTYYCGVPGHREAGMVGTLVVEP